MAPISSSLPAGPAQIHQVIPGETLWSIAQRYGVEIGELIRVNGVTDASRLEIGQRLVIPRSSRGLALSRGGPAVPARKAPPAIREVSPQWKEGSTDFIWPVEGRVISGFGMRRGSARNKGIDIQAPPGASVMASRGGTVSFVHENMPGFGKTIILDHGDEFATVYAYVGQILVQSGQPVAQRQVIARVGKTGRAIVPALHFEVRRRQKPQNPFHYLP